MNMIAILTVTTNPFDGVMDALIKVLVNILIMVIILGGAYATNWLREETTKVKDQRFADLLTQAEWALNQTVDATVKALNQTDVEGIKKVLTGADREKALLDIKKQALDKIKSNLLPKYTSVLETAVWNINDYISDMIEAKVYELKDASAVIVPEKTVGY